MIRFIGPLHALLPKGITQYILGVAMVEDKAMVLLSAYFSVRTLHTLLPNSCACVKSLLGRCERLHCVVYTFVR